MKRNLLTCAAVAAIALGGFALAVAQGGPGGHSHYGLSLQHLNQSLNLTADQQAKVQPILDAAKPQLQAIHQDAMQKAQSVIANANSQIRPLLNPSQQTKFDAMQKAHQDMANAMKEMHAAQSQ
jgi:hypothetical protein